VHFSERLSALDASFLALEDEGTHMHLAGIFVFDAGPLRGTGGRLDIGRIGEAIAAQLHRVPRSRQKLATVPLARRPVWIDDPDFNLQYHVRHTSLPPPADDRQLKRLAGRIMSQKLDRGKPLWEAWVVEALEGDRFALVIKTHQCMMDGRSGIDRMARLLAPTPDARPAPPPRWFPRPAPPGFQLLTHELHHGLGSPIAWLDRARDALRDPAGAIDSARQTAAAIGETLAAGIHPASRTPFNPAHIGPHRRLDWVAFDLDDVRYIRTHLGGTVNDVVLATVAGAIGAYLKRRRIRVDDLDFRALVPVSVRPRAGRGGSRGRAAMLLTELPIAESDPARRLRRVIQTMETRKRSGPLRGAELLDEASDRAASAPPNPLIRKAARLRAYNLVVTRVPGPTEARYLCGAPLLEPYPVLPLYSNQALGIALFSYYGGLYWGFNSDWDRIPDLHDLVDALALEFQDLRKAAKPPRSEPGASEATGGGARSHPAGAARAEAPGGAERSREPGSQKTL
jgi:diacylglycerol O-acyltransferase